MLVYAGKRVQFPYKESVFLQLPFQEPPAFSRGFNPLHEQPVQSTNIFLLKLSDAILHLQRTIAYTLNRLCDLTVLVGACREPQGP